MRAKADALGLRTAAKPDSQDTCFLPSAGGRTTFLGDRIPLRAGRVVDTRGETVGSVEAIELVSVGQRRGLGLGGGDVRYALAVDADAGVVTVGSLEELMVAETSVEQMTWVHGPAAYNARVFVQSSAHGASAGAVLARRRRASGTSRIVGLLRARAWCCMPTTTTPSLVVGSPGERGRCGRAARTAPADA